jgi:hypothetical protein
VRPASQLYLSTIRYDVVEEFLVPEGTQHGDLIASVSWRDYCGGSNSHVIESFALLRQREDTNTFDLKSWAIWLSPEGATYGLTFTRQIKSQHTVWSFYDQGEEESVMKRCDGFRSPGAARSVVSSMSRNDTTICVACCHVRYYKVGI